MQTSRRNDLVPCRRSLSTGAGPWANARSCAQKDSLRGSGTRRYSPMPRLIPAGLPVRFRRGGFRLIVSPSDVTRFERTRTSCAAMGSRCCHIARRAPIFGASGAKLSAFPSDGEPSRHRESSSLPRCRTGTKKTSTVTSGRQSVLRQPRGVRRVGA